MPSRRCIATWAGIRQPLTTYIGYSIIAGSDYALRHSSTRNLGRFNCIGILGYGKIGRSTAYYLHNLYPHCAIKICEQDKKRCLMAEQDGFETVNLDSFVMLCDFIFSITGNAALKAKHYDAIGVKGSIIACGTSPDDELNIDQLLADGTLIRTDKCWRDQYNICVSRIYKTNQGGDVELLGDGRTINTLMPAGSHHPTLALSEGLYIAQILSLIANRGMAYNDEINLPKLEVENIVIKAWLEEFSSSTSLGESLQMSLLDNETINAVFRADTLLSKEQVEIDKAAIKDLKSQVL